MSPARTPVAVITGASSGIGKAAAIELGRRGWFVIAVGRNAGHCVQAKREIVAAACGGARVEMLVADLAQLAAVRRLAGEISVLSDRVDALLNNAGGLTRDLTLTAEGNENTFASNHLGHFLLTSLLLPQLENAAADSPLGRTRVVNVASAAHHFCDGLDWSDLQSTRNFSSTPAYCRAKLANILFTRQLAKRLGGTKVVSHAMHPGLVDSNFVSYGDEAMQSYLQANTDKAVSPGDAADTLVWLATADEPANTSGNYYFQREPIPASAAASDDDAALRLWQESERLVSMTIAAKH